MRIQSISIVTYYNPTFLPYCCIPESKKPITQDKVNLSMSGKWHSNLS